MASPFWDALKQLAEGDARRATSLQAYPGLTLISGAPGSGKTRLLINLIDEIAGPAAPNPGCAIRVYADIGEWNVRTGSHTWPSVLEGNHDAQHLLCWVREAAEGDIAFVDDFDQLIPFWPSGRQAPEGGILLDFAKKIDRIAKHRGVHVIGALTHRSVGMNFKTHRLGDEPKRNFPVFRLKGGL
jgi:DNA polymerase III delta prime subunit